MALSFPDHLRLPDNRVVLPTTMSSAEIAELGEEIRRTSVFSARVTNAEFLLAIQEIAGRYQRGEIGLSTARVRLKDILRRLNYDPATGFPGDEELGIPPAEPGSMQDLSSDQRLELILETQAALLRSQAKIEAGRTRPQLMRFPCWELQRYKSSAVPRNWLQRWVKAGGWLARDAEGRAMMVALKWAPIWRWLGSRRLFEDALDVDTPPFAFNSGMGWRMVPVDEALELGVIPSEEHADPLNSDLGEAYLNAGRKSVAPTQEQLPKDIPAQTQETLGLPDLAEPSRPSPTQGQDPPAPTPEDAADPTLPDLKPEAERQPVPPRDATLEAILREGREKARRRREELLSEI